MSFPYKKILVLGATSGIGLGLAERLIAHGCFVIAVGRRKEHLDFFVQKHGAEKASAVQFDLGRLDAIPNFVKDVTNAHPDIDCVLANSGIQRRTVFSEPEAINMDAVQLEITVNYLSYLALTKEFVPFFTAKGVPTALAFTSSSLALVPILRCSNYCATKAALHQWVLCLREQLKGSNVKVIEIFPPVVQTELHDAKHQPDLAGLSPSFGMPLDQFVQETVQKLLVGDDQIAIGLSAKPFYSWEQERQQAFTEVVEAMKELNWSP